MADPSAFKSGDPPRATTAEDATTVREPTLFVSFYVHRHLPGFVDVDPRLVLLAGFDEFAIKYSLSPAGSAWPYMRASDIDLVALHRSAPSYQRLVNLRRMVPADGPVSPTLYQALLYTHADALIGQIAISNYDPWSGVLRNGWRDLTNILRAGFSGSALSRASQGVFGISAVYWALGDVDLDAVAFRDEVAFLSQGRALRSSQTDIGHLWSCDVPVLPDALNIAQRLWILITRRSQWAEEQANKRYSQPRLNGPSDFAVVALADHKFGFESAEYFRERASLERMRETLTRRAQWIVDAQRYHEENLNEVRAPDSIEFQQKLTRAATNVADFSQAVASVKELRRTLHINRDNFLINCPALLSADGATAIASADRQRDAALRFLADLRAKQQEHIFSTELGRMQNTCDQLDADVEYANLLLERFGASLSSGREQLQIAGERQLGEISHHIAVDTAAVVASLAAIVAVELLKLRGTLEHSPVFAGNIILLAVTASFAFVQMLTSPFHGKTWLERASFAATGGFIAGAFVAWRTNSTLPAFGWVSVGVFTGGVLAAGSIHGLIELRAIQDRQRGRQRRIHVQATLDKLQYAAEELPELLEDLPPAATYRVKNEASLREKVERKNAIEAANRHITVVELRQRGEDYRLTNVNDAIGIRYVVAPWRIPSVVDRVVSVTHATSVDYKSSVTTLISGKYKGFRLGYKAIHIDVDVWGVGAHKDVNLMAEIQIRTPIQNLCAAWFHDIMYKEHVQTAKTDGRSVNRWRRLVLFVGRPFLRLLHSAWQSWKEADDTPWLLRFFDIWHPWLNRPIARLLLWLSDAELWLFRVTMGWPEPEGRPSTKR